jgi:hypothetical protein
MSAAITIFIPKLRKSWTSAQLNHEIARAGFPVVLESFDPARQSGYVPAMVDGVRSGFEFYSDDVEAYLESVEDMRDDRDFPYSEEDLGRVAAHESVVQLIIHYRPREYAAAAVTAAALAALTGGLALDEPVWKWVSGDEALAWARDVYASHGSEEPEA